MAQEQVWQHFEVARSHGAPLKGEHGGTCNTYTCSNTGADWHSHSSGKYYCDSCARELNEACLAQGTRKVCQLHV